MVISGTSFSKNLHDCRLGFWWVCWRVICFDKPPQNWAVISKQFCLWGVLFIAVKEASSLNQPAGLECAHAWLEECPFEPDGEGEWSLKCSYWRKECIRIVSEAAVAGALYSASVDDRVVARHLFELHEMGLEPTKVMYTEVAVRSSRLPTTVSIRKGQQVSLSPWKMICFK